MTDDVDKELSAKYCQRFGMIAAEMGFISSDKIKEAMAEQMDDNFANKPHRLLGRILLERGWMSAQQVETVLNELFKRERTGEN